MKVVYVGHYSGDSGWGQAARDYILAMDSVGIDVVCRNIRLRHAQVKLPPRIEELEQKSAVGAKVVIQHVLPEHMEYHGSVKNIALHVDEVRHTTVDLTVQKLSMMDEVWCPNNQLSEECAYMTERTCLVVPHAFDMSRLMQNVKPLNICNDGSFCFYTIADMHRRKNLTGLMQAFNIAFHPNEPVNLVIKTGSHYLSPSEAKKHLTNVYEKSVGALGLRNEYKQPIIITERMTDEQIIALHKEMDCFVLPSFGEGWCIPGFEAMANGKYPIMTGVYGPADYIEPEVGDLLYCEEERIFGVENGVDYIYNANNIWNVCTVNEIVEAMKEAYENLTGSNDIVDGLAERSYNRANAFSYDAVGKRIQNILCE